MAIETTVVRRSFRTGSTWFPDPGPEYTPTEVKRFYERTHGFLTNFEIEGPTFLNDVETYTFVKAVGTKGA